MIEPAELIRSLEHHRLLAVICGSDGAAVRTALTLAEGASR